MTLWFIQGRMSGSERPDGSKSLMAAEAWLSTAIFGANQRDLQGVATIVKL